jgi:hypothetical protein
MPPQQVSRATKELVNREEMDAALARLAARPAVRIQRIDTTSAAFLCTGLTVLLSANIRGLATVSSLLFGASFGEALNCSMVS